MCGGEREAGVPARVVRRFTSALSARLALVVSDDVGYRGERKRARRFCDAYHEYNGMARRCASILVS